MSPPATDPRHARIARAERLLDRWLDLYEAALGQALACDPANPKLLDMAKVGDLANALTIVRRVVEIQTLALKYERLVAPTDETAHADLADLDPQLFAE